MTLEDFERSLADGRGEPQQRGPREGNESKHHKHHRHHHKRRHNEEDDAPRRREHKRAKRSTSIERENNRNSGGKSESRMDEQHDTKSRGEVLLGAKRNTRSPPSTASVAEQRQPEKSSELKRDSWMQMPSGKDIHITQRGTQLPHKPTVSGSSKADFELKIHDNELNKHHLQELADGKSAPVQVSEEPVQHDVDYVFGDAGSQWRMTKLRAVFRQADESGKPVEDVAIDQFGDLRAFDDAREEQTELERRETYGSGYVGKEKPSGEFFQERKFDEGIRRRHSPTADDGDIEDETGSSMIRVQLPETEPVALDHTALNRLKARMMKAKLRGAADATSLEAEYNAAMASSAKSAQPETVVLSTMESRMLVGGRKGEVKVIDNKRGRERGLVEENEDMSIEDMVREERRTRHQIGGEGQRFAERIAKDAKFDNDLDYLDENAAKLAKRVQKSEINLKNSAVSDVQKMSRILDNCPLCHKEDSNSPPLAPVVSLATRVYLTLPTEPEISDGGACIVPVQHRGNLLECDDDEWEEIRNFMKSLTRMYHKQRRDVIFYENAASPQRKKHAAMEVVPLPWGEGNCAPAFFKEAILSSDEEWTQHKKLIDTLSKANEGEGKLAFRRTLVKELPYFHVWFHIDGGMGHIVEDSKRWPKGDLFAREIIGGILGKGPEVIKRQGHWNREADRRVNGFRAQWREFDWTEVLRDDGTSPT